ncbi:alpha/beta fold hydrolase [Nonomuraea sp. NPDC047897]|uniref:alpha/beta fold hydrolase n=1 Tax=Nonomuraea sp. NPDC047897 TaxID=3364346 RepID=UPI00371C0569
MIHAADVNGISLTFRAEGDAAAPPMVLLHGRTADHNDWNGVTQHFAARHHVIVPDLRGHGASGRPDGYLLPDMAGDVAALLDHLGLDRATVVGHSLGGVVACVLAVRHPDRVERLVLEDAPPPYPLEGRPPLVEDGSTHFDWRMMHETERQLVRPDPAWAEALRRLEVPTLVLSGGSASPFRSERLAELIPGARLVTIEVGHLIHVGDRRAFLRAVDDFLTDTGAGTATGTGRGAGAGVS